MRGVQPNLPQEARTRKRKRIEATLGRRRLLKTLRFDLACDFDCGDSVSGQVRLEVVQRARPASGGRSPSTVPRMGSRDDLTGPPDAFQLAAVNRASATGILSGLLES